MILKTRVLTCHLYTPSDSRKKKVSFVFLPYISCVLCWSKYVFLC